MTNTNKNWVERFDKKCNQELGRISGVFMSQGDTRSGDIVMPTEELLKATENLKEVVYSLLSEIREEIRGKEKYIEEHPCLFACEWNDLENYNKALEDILSLPIWGEEK